MNGKPITKKQARRNRIEAETLRLTDLGLDSKEIAEQLHAKHEVILRLLSLHRGD